MDTMTDKNEWSFCTILLVDAAQWHEACHKGMKSIHVLRNDSCEDNPVTLMKEAIT